MPVERIVSSSVAVFTRAGDVAGGQRVEPAFQRGDVATVGRRDCHLGSARSGIADGQRLRVKVRAERCLRRRGRRGRERTSPSAKAGASAKPRPTIIR